jgi:hypothetical protein
VRTLPTHTVTTRAPRQAEQGSQVTEYALLLVVAAAVAMVLLTWARGGGIASMLDTIIGQVFDVFSP